MAHVHDHDHHHGHDHAPRGATPREPALSLLRVSALVRLAIIGVGVAALWGAVFWAIS